MKKQCICGWMAAACIGCCCYSRAGEEPWDPAKFAYEITKKDLGEENFKVYLKKSRLHLETYLQDIPDSDAETFLNDRLANKANEVSDIESLKKFVAWMGLYYAWRVPLHPKAAKNLKAREEDLKALAKDFTWEKLFDLTQGHKAAVAGQ